MTNADPAWWKSAVVYQIYPRSFADSDGDGIGDLNGIIDRLDHLQRLGIDVLWLSPIYRSPQADNGYDISDYRDIDPLFGSLDTFDTLLEAAHRRGIKLVMDLVVNHTSDEHDWFRQSRSSRDDDKRDWYIWRDARDGEEPNNWGSLFGGSAWQWDEHTGQYYLHLFDVKQPDLNWRDPRVRSAVYEMMRWWLRRGVDGFRMDVINFISKADGLPDAPEVQGKRFVSAFSLFADGPHVHEYLQEMSSEVFGDRRTEYLTVGEMPGVTPGEAQLYTDPARGELDMVFQFEHVMVDQGPGDKFDYRGFDLVTLKRSLNRWQRALADTGWNSLYWNNHDQPRVVSRFGDDDREYWRASATALGTILHGMRGTPYVYQGEELGMTNYPFSSLDQLRDVESVNYVRSATSRGIDEQTALRRVAVMGRDNARTPMQWNDSPGAGFTTGTPWLPVNPNHVWLNAAAEVDDPTSVFAHYRRLIRLRHEEPVLVHGEFAPLWEDDHTLWGYTRTLPADLRSQGAGTRMLVVANCGRAERRVRLDAEWTGARLLLGNLPDTPELLETPELVLRGWDARMLIL